VNYTLELMWRGLRRDRRLNLMIIATLSLGMATCMTAFAIWAQLSVDPLPGRSGQLYSVRFDSSPSGKDGAAPAGALPDLITMVDGVALSQALSMVPRALMYNTVVQARTDTARLDDQTVLATGRDVFAMFGLELVSGRIWTEDEAQQGADVVVLSQTAATGLFGTADALGQRVALQGKPFRVIGISRDWHPPLHFYLPSTRLFRHTWEDMLMPSQSADGLTSMIEGSFGCDSSTALAGSRPDPLHCRWLTLWVQVSSGADRSTVASALHAYAVEQQQSGRFNSVRRSALTPLNEWLTEHKVVPDDVRVGSVVAVGLFLVCLANMAGLLSARFLFRSSEFGIRRALGARRRALFQHCLGEAAALALLSGVVALPLLQLGLCVIRAQRTAYVDFAHVDTMLYVALLLSSVLVALLVAAVPAWRASRVAPALQVKHL